MWPLRQPLFLQAIFIFMLYFTSISFLCFCTLSAPPVCCWIKNGIVGQGMEWRGELYPHVFILIFVMRSWKPQQTPQSSAVPADGDFFAMIAGSRRCLAASQWLPIIRVASLSCCYWHYKGVELSVDGEHVSLATHVLYGTSPRSLTITLAGQTKYSHLHIYAIPLLLHFFFLKLWFFFSWFLFLIF